MTHTVDYLHLADKIVVLEKGEIITFGTFVEFLANDYMKRVLEIHYKERE
jgi:ABC-type multidrug transport system fused ATPase/permease subunit